MSETTWRLAPAEATEEMAVRAFQTVDLALAAVEMGPCDQYRYAYRASLSAAPKPPAGLYVVSEDGTARRVEVDVIRFVKWIVEKSWDGCDVDGADIQDLAIKCGILTEVEFDPEKHDDPFWGSEPGDPWLVFSDGFRALTGEER